jgi:hypothetical protein
MRPRRRICIQIGSVAAILLLGGAGLWSRLSVEENARSTAADFGSGPGRAAAWVAHAAPSIPAGGPAANVKGVFGAAVSWPIDAIHMALLPDGRVLNFGSSLNGNQGAAYVYDIWSPTVGTGSDAHLVLPNTTATNIFCAGQSYLANFGVVAMVGGTGVTRGYPGISNTTLFTPATNSIAPGPSMLYPRWYATMTMLPNGHVFVAGGTGLPGAPEETPELYAYGTGWTALKGASSKSAFGSNNTNWFYPRLVIEPSGDVLDIGYDGVLYDFNLAGTGSVSTLPANLMVAHHAYPLAMFAPGKILTLRQNATVQILDLTGSTPVVTSTAAIDQIRFWSNMTVLADGTVLVNGGSAEWDSLSHVDYTAEIWNPATGTWTAGATAAIPRLYHSTALLLPDATVITAGGGNPGPVLNLNAEIYYPPYLFDANGAPASRPAILDSPPTISAGQTLTISVNQADAITAVTLVRAGSVTHSENLDQRFFNLSFTQRGTQVSAVLPANANLLLQGTYMIFVLRNGVPSVARMIQVMPP